MSLDNVLDQFFQNLLLFWFQWRHFFGGVFRMTGEVHNSLCVRVGQAIVCFGQKVFPPFVPEKCCRLFENIPEKIEVIFFNLPTFYRLLKLSHQVQVI